MSEDNYTANLKLTVQGQQALDDLISSFAKARDELPQYEKMLNRVERDLAKVGAAARDTGDDVAAGGKSIEGAASGWDAYREKLEKANAAYREFKRGQVSGAGGGIDPATLKAPERAELLGIADAENASAISRLREREANEKRVADRAAQAWIEAEERKGAVAAQVADRAAQSWIQAEEDRLRTEQRINDRSAQAWIENEERKLAVSKRIADRAAQAYIDAEEEKERKLAAIAADKANQTQGRGYANASTINDGEIAQRQVEMAAFGQQIRRQMEGRVEAEREAVRSAEELAKAHQRQLDDLPRLRYALYDLSNATAVSGAAMLAAGVIAAGTAVQYESLFADVERTSELLNTQGSDTYFAGLKEDLLDLTGELPVAFDQIAKIATLGNQLGVDPSGLQNYTKTVAEFTAVTGLATEAAATQLARVGQLTGQGDYKALGDQVAYLGVRAVATEQQILGVSEEIAVSATAAGFASDQTVALATAMASLGIAPEQARGSILRTFGEITTAVDENGDQLKAFAAISGDTAEGFAATWKTRPQTALNQFLMGLQRVEAAGGNVDGTLKGLGITATRDSQSIQLLAQNLDVYRQSQKDLNGADGFLQESTDVKLDTTAAKIQILQNNVQRLLDTMGSGTLDPISALVDGLGGITNALNGLLQNPVATWLAAAGVGLLGLLGVTGLIVGAFLRFSATVLGVRTAQNELGANTNILRFTLDQLNASFQRASVGAAGLTAAEGALTGASGRAAAGQGALNAAQATGATSGGKLTTILGAAGLAGTVLTLTSLFYSGVDAVFAWGSSITGATTNAQGLIDKLTELQGKQQSLNGEGGVLPSALTNKSSPGTRLPAADLYANQRDSGAAIPNGKNPDGSQALETAMKATTITANNYKAALAELDAALAKLVSDGNTQGATALADAYRDSIQGTKLETESFTTLLPQYSGALGSSADAASRAAANAEYLKNAVGGENFEIKDLIGTVYGAYNAQYALAQSSGALGEAFVNSGAEVAFSGEAMQKVIADIYASSSSAPEAAAKMQGLFNALVAGSYASTAQLAGLQSMIARLTGGKGVVKAATFDMGNFTKGVQKATKAVGGGGGGGGGGAGGGGLTKAVRTLVDYANDLQGVFKRAFDIRFSGDQGADTIATSWTAAKKKFEEADKAVVDLRASMQGVNDQINQYRAEMATLTSDKSIKEYWLGIAEAYGDTLRAGQLRAEIGEIDADLASKTTQVSDAQAENAQNAKDLQVAQDATSRALTGNTEAAIANRAQLLGLIQNYQDQITKLAAAGLSTDELNRRTAELRAEFIRQATQMGYNRDEVNKYAVAFDDMTAAINRVPKNITVDANADPAIQALNEFAAKADQAGKDAANSIRTGGGNGYSVPAIDIPPIPEAIIPIRYSYNDIMLMQQQLRDITGDKNFRIATGRQGGQVIGSGNPQNDIKGPGFDQGGYTGAGNRKEYAGSVHRGEFVLNQTGIKQFPREMLEAANRGRAPQVAARVAKGGNSASRMVELSPYDRELLRQAGNVNVTIPRSAIADAASSAGVNASNRGEG